MDGYGLVATTKIRMNELIGGIWGQFFWRPSGEAENNPSKHSEEFGFGFRNRLMQIKNRERKSLFGFYPLISGAIDEIEAETKSLEKNDPKKVIGYLSMHEWSAVGRVNSSIGAGDWAVLSVIPENDESAPAGSTLYAIHDISSEYPVASSSNAFFIRLNAKPNAEFIIDTKFDEKFMEKFKDSHDLPPFVTHSIRAVKSIKPRAPILVEYEYTGMPDQSLVRLIHSSKKEVKKWKAKGSDPADRIKIRLLPASPTREFPRRASISSAGDSDPETIDLISLSSAGTEQSADSDSNSSILDESQMSDSNESDFDPNEGQTE